MRGQRRQYLAGGTTLLDLMKLDVMRPARVVDINPLSPARTAKSMPTAEGLRLGALARMAQVAGHDAGPARLPGDRRRR